jgi:hypothetical protein
MKDLYELKRSVAIIDYAAHLGYTLTKAGSYYSLKEHDSVRIDPVKNLFYQNSTGRSGSVIDFATAFEGISIAEAIKKVEQFNGGGIIRKIQPVRKKDVPEERSKKPEGFQLPKRDVSMKNIFAYLMKSRGISPAIIEELIHKKQLYQDEKKNCVFITYDEQNHPVFACLRGTNTYKRFLGDVPGSDYAWCFFVDNMADKLIITESPIDAMSMMDLLEMDGEDYRGYNYLALAGVSKAGKTLEHHLKRKRYETVMLCLDRDTAGRKASTDIQNLLKEESKAEVIERIPKEKDCNEDLLVRKEGRR